MMPSGVKYISPKKTQHPSNNLVLGAPAGWDQAQLPCDALAVTRTEVQGQPAIVSYWEPMPEEIALLQVGGKVALWVFGTGHPPVVVGVEA